MKLQRLLTGVFILFFTISSFFVFSFRKFTKKTVEVKYVALGDSYTIGTGVDPKESWPSLLTEKLNQIGIKTNLVANPSKNGFTTKNLIQAELPILRSTKADFVTILIGANDIVQGVDAESYQKNLEFIIDETQKCLENKSRILLVTIPDFSMTPAGKSFGNSDELSKAIIEFNKIIHLVGDNKNLLVSDIQSIMKSDTGKNEFLASDQLHPNGKAYEKWQFAIVPQARKTLWPVP